MCSCGTAVSPKSENKQGSRVQQSKQKRIWSSSLPDSVVEGVSRGKRPLSAYERVKQDFLRPDPVKDKTDFLKNVSKAVIENHGQMALLDKYSFIIGPLEDTPYRGRRDMFDEWEQFYLRDHMFMEVIGVGKSLAGHKPKAELVLMVCENGKVYGYEDNHLHLVAGSLKDLFDRGIKFPGTRKYYRGQSFKDVTEDQWKKAKESDKVREMMEKQKNREKKMKLSWLQNLKIIQQYNRQMPAGAAAAQPVPVK